MPQTMFFATKDDLAPVLEQVENKGPLKYVRFGRSLNPRSESFDRGIDIPSLGIATCGSAIGSDSFLVCYRESQIDIRVVHQSDGVRSFHTDQLTNPDSVTFSSGGVWKPEILLYGRVASASNSPVSKSLLRRFQSSIRKHFVKVGACYVGPNALQALKDGKRLTIAEQSPREFDLVIR